MDFINILISGDWNSGCDLANQWHIARFFRSHGAIFISNLKGAALGLCALDQSLFGQDFELIFDRGRGGKASGLTDLTHRWGIAVLLNGGLDDCEDFGLAGG